MPNIIKTKKIRRATYLFFAAMVIVLEIVVLLAMTSGAQTYGAAGSVMNLDAGWYLEDGTPVSLPYSVSTDAEYVKLSRVLPKLHFGEALYIQTDYQRVSASIDGTAVSANEFPSGDGLSFSCGNKWNSVKLSPDASGKIVELTIGNAGSKPSVDLYRVLFGNEDSVRFALLRSDAATLVVFVMMLVIGAGMFISAIIMYLNGVRDDMRRSVWLGITVLLSALWVFTDSNLQAVFFMGNRLFFLVNLYSYMLLPTTFLFFAREYRRGGNVCSDILNIIVMLTVAAVSALILLGRMTLYLTLMMTHVEIVAVFAMLVAGCVRQVRKFNDKTLLPMLAALCIFACMSAADLAVFYVSSSGVNSAFFRYGMLLFVFTLAANTLKNSFKNLRRAQSFEELAKSIPCGICRVDCSDPMNIRFANDFFYKIFGYTVDEADAAQTINTAFVLIPETVDKFKRDVRDAISQGKEHFELELNCARKDGEPIWVLARCSTNSSFTGFDAVVIDITDRKMAEKQLRISESAYRVVVEHSGKIISRFDVSAGTAILAKEVSELFGLPEIVENVPESIIESGNIAESDTTKYRNFFEEIVNGSPSGSVVLLRRDSRGEWAWYSVEYTTIFDESGKPATALIALENVTKQREHELAYARWQENYLHIPSESMNHYEYSLTNGSLEREEGCMFEPIPQGVETRLLPRMKYCAEHYVYPYDRQGFLDFFSRERLLSCFERGIRSDSMEYRRLGSDGRSLWTSAEIQLIPDPYSSDTKVFILLRDIDDSKRAELELEARSVQDALTGILNRRAFIERAEEILAGGGRHTLIIADLDDFKRINDTFGHQEGDSLIIDIARKLGSCIRDGDLCGRLGGDEFVAFMRDTQNSEELTARVNSLCELFRYDRGNDIKITVSIGAAVSSPRCRTFEELYGRADIALYEAKRLGRDCAVFYNSKMSRVKPKAAEENGG